MLAGKKNIVFLHLPNYKVRLATSRLSRPAAY
ncbi:hypothetical protein RB2501_10537 [Robiginitalea biformata HTCC2501]|uniref:Uncharacterized protein n=1 Tax=Robiginitalea biformata (strain ATCC BAA-864 / DSM 15991 / KCTC 12146 / HTCC2501) TaxID=313596 RepID=A4CM64_ROBBH|nr:hypothetical protein RB2501_10537 [Robiginitalea biformata HTCC2501]